MPEVRLPASTPQRVGAASHLRIDREEASPCQAGPPATSARRSATPPHTRVAQTNPARRPALLRAKLRNKPVLPQRTRGLAAQSQMRPATESPENAQTKPDAPTAGVQGVRNELSGHGRGRRCQSGQSRRRGQTRNAKRNGACCPSPTLDFAEQSQPRPLPACENCGTNSPAPTRPQPWAQYPSLCTPLSTVERSTSCRYSTMVTGAKGRCWLSTANRVISICLACAILALSRQGVTQAALVGSPLVYPDRATIASVLRPRYPLIRPCIVGCSNAILDAEIFSSERQLARGI